MMSSTAFALEKRLFLTAVPGLWAFAVLIILALMAGIAGRATVERVDTAQTAFLEEKGGALGEWRDKLEALESGEAIPKPYDARPMNIRMPAVLPTAPLGDFAIANAGLYPTTTLITGWSNPVDLFASYEFANPRLLALGGFDLSFLTVVIMPLLMIAVSFDILPGERQQGRIRLVTIQAGQISTSTWTRLVIRNTALWAVFAGVTLLLATIPASAAGLSDRLGAYAAWLAIAALYGLFWFALIALANIVIRRAETVAATLFAAWAVFVFAVPAVGGAIAEATSPPPSRLAFLSEMRQGEVAAIRETEALTAGFLADHPELTVSDDAVPAYYRSNFLANQEIAERTTPILNAFKRSRDERSALVAKLQYLSPALIADKALTSIAGGNVARYMAFQQQAQAALSNLNSRIGPSVVAKQRLSLAEFDAISPFGFQEQSIANTLTERAGPLLYLLFVSVALLSFARRKLNAPLERLV